MHSELRALDASFHGKLLHHESDPVPDDQYRSSQLHSFHCSQGATLDFDLKSNTFLFEEAIHEDEDGNYY